MHQKTIRNVHFKWRLRVVKYIWCRSYSYFRNIEIKCAFNSIMISFTIFLLYIYRHWYNIFEKRTKISKNTSIFIRFLFREWKLKRWSIPVPVWCLSLIRKLCWSFLVDRYGQLPSSLCLWYVRWNLVMRTPPICIIMS